MSPNSISSIKETEFSDTISYLKGRLDASGISYPTLGIVCGSGLSGLVQCFDNTVKPLIIPYKDIPHFVTSSVQGHKGQLEFGVMQGVWVVVMVGRLHCYEGHLPEQTVYPIRCMSLLGVTRVILTNASGGLNPGFKVGDFMIINDHISWAGMGGINPLIGPNISSLGPRFPPISAAYPYELRNIAANAAQRQGILDRVHEGTYVFVMGPSFETRAEARMLHGLGRISVRFADQNEIIGCDCVGMSTVPEVVAAVHCGLEILALSLITNRVATGFPKSCIAALRGTDEACLDEGLVASHEEVLETGRSAGGVFTEWVRDIIKDIGRIHK